ncbi:hypothetical protein BKA65DRAFT_451501 [Rhexocercosporidium sp. MPI-PUGE-AT-0058]|nr:hypothetical protein BKA65DRAFT_451501 [Rhexocercosporidium sp. MPI-PUGE-AT-0058]
MRHRARRRLIGNRTHFREHPAIQPLNAILCCPCSLIGAVSHGVEKCYKAVRDYELPSTKREKAANRVRYEWEKTQPWNLAIGRSRHLSLEQFEEKGTTQTKKLQRRKKYSHQNRSLLFMLPLELREQIWKDVLGGYVFHINYSAKNRRMTHTRCKAVDHRICRYACFPLQPAVPDRWGLLSLLALPKSCRRLYRETIHMLYSQNIFIFHTHVNILKLFPTIPAPRIHQIKSISWTRRPHASANDMRRDLVPIDLTEILDGMPWLDCKKNEVPIEDEFGCLCVDCWTENVYKDVKTQEIVLRRWLKDSVEEGRRAA